MDAGTIVGLLIFIVCAALLEQSVMGAMWDAGDQDETESTATEDGYSKERKLIRRQPSVSSRLPPLKLHRTE